MYRLDGLSACPPGHLHPKDLGDNNRAEKVNEAEH
jgi:hypothetical protein